MAGFQINMCEADLDEGKCCSCLLRFHFCALSYSLCNQLHEGNIYLTAVALQKEKFLILIHLEVKSADLSPMVALVKHCIVRQLMLQ